MNLELSGLGPEFAAPALLLTMIPAVFVLAAQALQPRGAAPVGDAGPIAFTSQRTWRIRLRRVPDLLRALAILLLILALARPREGLAITTLPEEGIDIVAVVDVSGSMRIPFEPRETRLQAAHRVLDDFAQSVEGSRLGLVSFQSRAVTLSPLTADLRAVRKHIPQLEPGLVADGTAIGLGLAEGLTLLDDSIARNRVVVLLTDGENNMGEIQPFTAARMAEALGIRVYVVGVHSPLRDEVDQQAMTALAESTGGSYFDARSATDLEEAYSTIASLERSRLGETEFVTWREFGPWLALAATFLLLSDMSLRSTWLRRSP